MLHAFLYMYLDVIVVLSSTFNISTMVLRTALLLAASVGISAYVTRPAPVFTPRRADRQGGVRRMTPGEKKYGVGLDL